VSPTDGTAELNNWLEQVATELDVNVDGLDTSALLDVARDVAHHRIRPGAPTSTFVIGVALGAWQQQNLAVGTPPTAEERAQKLLELCAQVQALAVTEPDS
jgi:hypothetical protein